MQMAVPDYWKGRGRYSKQACSRKTTDESPIHPVEDDIKNQSDE